MEGVGEERRYLSPLRAQQAAATRRTVLDAARELFVEQGYGATTVDQIAARAGVSKPTVFTAVGNKQTVLSAVRDVAMAGDDDAIAVKQRPLAQEIFRAPDQGQAMELLAELITGIDRRYARIDRVLSGAASSGESSLRELWETSEAQRLTGARLWATALSSKGRLRDGVDLDAAVDILWLHMAPDLYHRLVHDRGWTAERFQRWLVDTLSHQLFPGRPEREAAP
ncbi:MAG: Transcriptional regulator, TetR family [Frankiales bacterium]|nr:Transcriptional regulator, TetR family [Frankiales bacterium]